MVPVFKRRNITPGTQLVPEGSFSCYKSRYETKPKMAMSLNLINSIWDSPDPYSIIELLKIGNPSKALENKAIFLIVDGLHNISKSMGEDQIIRTLTKLGDLAQHALCSFVGRR
jgi:hypothetical protein